MSIWKQFNPNPQKRNVGDCSIRAISAALGVDWVTAYEMVADAGLRLFDMPSSNAVWGSVLRDHGFKRYIIPNACPDCYTLGDFAYHHPNGINVVGTGNHVATVISGTVWDSWYSLSETPIFYWRKDEK